VSHAASSIALLLALAVAALAATTWWGPRAKGTEDGHDDGNDDAE